MTDLVDPMVLYVLMRTDVPDYVPGKAMAQANHAGTQFIIRAAQFEDRSFTKHFDEWISEGDMFGTCIVLGCTHLQMKTRLGIAHGLGLLTGIVHDPTYPIRDGHTMFTAPIDTCGYVFGRKSRCSLALEGLSLF